MNNTAIVMWSGWNAIPTQINSGCTGGREGKAMGGGGGQVNSSSQVFPRNRGPLMAKTPPGG